MIRNPEIMFWKSNPLWYTGDPARPATVRLTEEAPPRARSSFAMWRAYFMKQRPDPAPDKEKNNF